MQLERHVAYKILQPALYRRVHILVREIPRELSRLYLLQHRLEPRTSVADSLSETIPCTPSILAWATEPRIS